MDCIWYYFDVYGLVSWSSTIEILLTRQQIAWKTNANYLSHIVFVFNFQKRILSSFSKFGTYVIVNPNKKENSRTWCYPIELKENGELCFEDCFCAEWNKNLVRWCLILVCNNSSFLVNSCWIIVEHCSEFESNFSWPEFLVKPKFEFSCNTISAY